MIQKVYKDNTRKQYGRAIIPYWWNDSIATRRRECTKLRRKLTRETRAQGTNNNNGQILEETREAYKTCKRELVKRIKEAKRRCWKDLCLELDGNIWGDAYKIVAKKFKMLCPYDLSPDKRAQILRVLFPSTSSDLNTEAIVNNMEPFTAEELENAIASMKPGKAPGLDKLPAEAIKEVASCAPELVLSIMNDLISKQKFPDSWKVAKVARARIEYYE
ncbi:hypothetical protein QE152_g7903 [Popillia japonica]|uniref:Reverse transcriptase n=1 Tax=Popillia japonica TaxID=7064 RepID=A0AAW1M6Z9_POPJA